MPLPVIAVGIALAAAGSSGTAAGGSGLLKMRKAKRTVAAAQEELEALAQLTVERRATCEGAFVALGERKLTALDEALIPFHGLFSQLKNVELQVEVKTEGAPALDAVKVLEAGKVSASMVDAIGATALAGAAGAASSAAATAGVGALATASTGTAISGLSGAAASNATLAWLGGGTIASGGGGVAAGTMVMSGVATAPALLVGGVFLHQKGRRAIANAEAFEADAEVAVAKHHESQSVLDAATNQATIAGDLLARLTPRLARQNGWLEFLVARETDWQAYSPEERERVREVAVLAMATSALVHTQVVDDEGSLTAAIRKACDHGAAVAG